jgi:hypothetical protein
MIRALTDPSLSIAHRPLHIVTAMNTPAITTHSTILPSEDRTNRWRHTAMMLAARDLDGAFATRQAT